MNDFEKALLNYFTEQELQKIQSVKIGIAGAGGLGSNCAFNLTRSGFKQFVICDFDVVEYKNLNRQFFFLDQVGIAKVLALKTNLSRINPDVEIIAKQVKLDYDNIEEIFSNCDIIVEAFDKANYKKMIAETFLPTNKILVSASGLAGIGNSDDIKTKKIRKNFYLIGDQKSAVSDKLPPCSPRVNIAAAKEADVILDLVINGELI
ncbi:MAG: thiamine biosynthesis protein ThiF [Spirochaetes bacterium GWC1_27_15]|nr:MAG: thiamine biosynthesis protein ThiF [Spirochaetes bacterium GWB1_27_13]OHD24456.1 MAG: thiamine biosynthesis protein ThiF [Spirochaetes bacterium GWC1_27_15]